MIPLNIMIGTYEAFYGFITLILIIIIETLIISYGLTNKYFQKNILITLLASNLISTFFGLLGFLDAIFKVIWKFIKLNVPLSEEYSGYVMGTTFLLTAFLLTLLIEIPLNIIMLRQYYSIKQIIKYSIYANLLTYIFLSIIFIIIFND